MESSFQCSLRKALVILLLHCNIVASLTLSVRWPNLKRNRVQNCIDSNSFLETFPEFLVFARAVTFVSHVSKFSHPKITLKMSMQYVLVLM